MNRPAAPDILIVGDAASIHVRRLAAGLRDAGRSVELACFDGASISGIPMHELGSLGPAHDRRYVLGIPRLARIIRGRRPRLINAHYLTSFGLMTALAARLAHPAGGGPPVVQTTWGDDLLVTPLTSALHRRLAAHALRTADLVTGDSRDLEVAAKALVPSMNWHRFVFGPPRLLLTAPAAKGLVIVSARLLIPSMRVDLVVRAFLAARAARPGQLSGWALHVVGSGSDRSRLEALAADDSAVRFMGRVSHDELMGLLLTSAIVVSVPESDATSASLLESLAAGALPIVNELPANREWVGPDIGEVVPRDPTVDQLADAMLRATVRPANLESIRAAVSANTWERELDRLIEAFDRVTEGSQR